MGLPTRSAMANSDIDVLCPHDYIGAALFTAALVPILVGLTNKGSADWSDPFVGGLIGLGR